MWISYTDSEVKKFHPICESALNAALVKLAKSAEYEVLHHKYTGSLEMDFVIQNTKTKRYLCVIEVKRTPSDVNSARYQYQAMSYVQMNVPVSEKPYYILTNLEYALAFRYDKNRPRVFQQMLQPGLCHIGDFLEEQVRFEKKLVDYFATILDRFFTDEYDYLLTLEQFENHMKNLVNNTAKWRSSLIVLLYEYIRGVFLSVGRRDLPYDVRVFHNNIERICAEAANVNFKEIFSYLPGHDEKTVCIGNDVLSNIFDFGKQNISGDSLAELLHSIVASGLQHEGAVPTDIELARVVSILAKNIVGKIKECEYVCDPAAGSGNLLSAAAEVFSILPKQIKANDINERLLELLSLRIGLNFAKTINNKNTAEISAKNIIDLPQSYFENVAVIVMNPPFVAGINCVERKLELFKRIQKIKNKEPMTSIGQMNLEGAFLETICSLSRPGTVISCVLPKAHLVARGSEAVILRNYLLSEFGLTTIFTYPEEGLFENVYKETCVVVGRVGIPANVIKFVSSSARVSDIDLHAFEKEIDKEFQVGAFRSIAPGVEGMSQTKKYLLSTVTQGWRIVCQEFHDALLFLQNYIVPNVKFVQLSGVTGKGIELKRGAAGNSGASDLLMLDRAKGLFAKYKNYPMLPAMRNAKLDDFLVTHGDSACFDISQISAVDLSKIISDYVALPVRASLQQRKQKSVSEIEVLLNATAKNTTPPYAVLIPRGIRAKGRVYVTKNETLISTNLIAITMEKEEWALILGSWVCTIFYQLICEVNAKPQEGMRKMEVHDIEATYIPIVQKLTREEKISILSEVSNIEFLELNRPKVRKIDEIWASVLFGTEADVRLNEAKRFLDLLANTRNPIK